ncbi:solute carrier family 41 member 1 [Platysternon megacephalum]|uniref:Solute carrier family 41 member 1 n=1 Tax=Platysternon megacephalum TaxID=55544 RepID=A0A4D9E0K3_9SAUR|nr:solute carrier family 41 member 1 [Platysternon megacephalum]
MPGSHCLSGPVERPRHVCLPRDREGLIWPWPCATIALLGCYTYVPQGSGGGCYLPPPPQCPGPRQEPVMSRPPSPPGVCDGQTPPLPQESLMGRPPAPHRSL